ncbi:MATE family efflux transporter [Micrococcus luteus]|uniref:MATE family efflux transporter n=1 Tax=Micrococcus luteus TaxID=1270 RepID=UPI001E42D54C|nr:MATE family efflux transporter [Micrococcus luteus]MCD0181129.1 MATE family efflux transporter [Micrococcus luteus]
MAGPSGSTAAPAPQDARALTRRILALAVPAFGALIAEPLFLLADTAIIGHLGTAQLAGVGIGTTILHTLTGLMIFLAYATTPAVARLIGAGNLAAAMDRGRDGIWLGLLLGAVLAVLGWLAAPALTAALGATGEVQAHAVAYLRWSMPGLPALLAVLAATGVLRGLQDTVTPLVVAGVGFGANIGLNVALVYGLGWGVAGSAIGTSVVQWAMLVTYLFVLAPRFRRSGTAWAPRASGMRATAQVGSWLLLRTASLRAAILITVMAAAGAGDLTLAAHQLVFTLFSTLAFALDALAIAAQALIGAELGAARPDAARRLTRTMVHWGLGFGVVTGAVLALAAPVLPGLFTTDPTVQAAATVGLWVLAAGQPVAGYVFVLDGVLIGAGDARYLALAGLVNLVVYAPALWVLAQLATGGFGWTAVWPGPNAAVPDAGVQLGLLWLGFAGVYMGMRALTLGWRARRDDWMRLGVG